MKKRFFLCITFLLIMLITITGCGQESKTEKDNKQPTSESENVEVENKAPIVDWAAMYLDAIREGKIKVEGNMLIQFIDVDFDDIPEMYYSYVGESSENFKKSPSNKEGLSTFTGSAYIYVSSNNEATVFSSNSSEVARKDAGGNEFAFVHLLPTDEYVWAKSNTGAEYYIKSRETDESYNASTQRGTKTASSEIVYEYTGIYTPRAISIAPDNIDMDAYNKAVNMYTPNNVLIKEIKEGVDISDWAAIYKKYITEKELLTAYGKGQIVFIDIDDNGIPDMLHSYKDERGYIVVKTYKLSKTGNVVPVGVANNPPNYGSGYNTDTLKVRYGYINVLERNGWVLTSPTCELLLTDDFTVDVTKSFGINSGSNTGMAQYNKYVVCELVPESQIPGNAGKFVDIDMTEFDDDFDAAFEEAVSRYVPNTQISGEKNDTDEDSSGNDEKGNANADNAKSTENKD